MRAATPRGNPLSPQPLAGNEAMMRRVRAATRFWPSMRPVCLCPRQQRTPSPGEHRGMLWILGQVPRRHIKHGGTLMWLTKGVLTPGCSGVDASFQKAMTIAGGPIFVSFDIDAVQGSDCPGVSCPGSVGLSSQNALDISRMAGRNPSVLLMDVSELNPAVEDYRSPRLAVMMFYHFLLGLTERPSA